MDLGEAGWGDVDWIGLGVCFKRNKLNKQNILREKE
jgi:hypothetical protein